MRRLTLNEGWEFRRCEGTAIDADWSRVALPHSPFVADLDGREHWFGLCQYRHSLRFDEAASGTSPVLHIGAAMHSARILLDGREVGRHRGGYLPFGIALGSSCLDGQLHELLVELDNREDPDVPPGKAYGELDFCWYGGLYRDAEIQFTPAVAITDPIMAAETAGGGVFFRTLHANPEEARILVRVHACNAGSSPLSVRACATLSFKGVSVASSTGSPVVLQAGESRHLDLEFELRAPCLWDVAEPNLHDLAVRLTSEDGTLLDDHTLRVGIRRISFSRSGGFVLNGQRRRLRGTNRHQEQPRAGYAAPQAAQYRDARRIKEAGFDYVRLSHYPQSPAFLDACDELGIVVMNAIPGWQFIGGDAFREACFQNARDLIRRDRNHPSVVLWELSLNETPMDDAFMAELQRIGHEEYPGDQMFTCGWMDRFDVYLRSRQHGGIHDWKNADKALIVAEYGDWEFYAMNEGFDQATGAGLLPACENSRQRRKDGEKGLLTQARNVAIALNDTLSSPAVLDGQWSTFDYARGYHPERAACGVMDVHRLPKFSYQFYRSQRDPAERGAAWSGGPMVFIASHWTPSSNLRVRVFSNCDEVSLSLNGEMLETRQPERNAGTRHLPHPPFEFRLPGFKPGTLEAIGLMNGQPVARHRVSTPGAPAQLCVNIDTCGVQAAPGAPDLLFAHASLCDGSGECCLEANAEVDFEIEGAARILGPTRVATEAGVASIVLQIEKTGRPWQLRARTGTLTAIS